MRMSEADCSVPKERLARGDARRHVPKHMHELEE